MTDNNTSSTTTTNDSGNSNDDAPLGDSGLKALNAERDARKTAEATVKQLRNELKDKESHHEQAITEASANARRDATKTLGAKLVRAEFEKLASKRNSEFDVEPVMAYVSLDTFIDPDKGEVNVEDLTTAVNSLVPEATSQTNLLDLDLGSRPSSVTNGKRSNADIFATFAEEQLKR